MLDADWSARQNGKVVGAFNLRDHMLILASFVTATNHTELSIMACHKGCPRLRQPRLQGIIEQARLETAEGISFERGQEWWSLCKCLAHINAETRIRVNWYTCRSLIDCLSLLTGYYDRGVCVNTHTVRVRRRFVSVAFLHNCFGSSFCWLWSPGCILSLVRLWHEDLYNFFVFHNVLVGRWLLHSDIYARWYHVGTLLQLRLLLILTWLNVN